MKKWILAMAMLAAVLLSACSGTRSTSENVEHELGISLPETISVTYANTHGGFHGDGETWIALNFTAEGAKELSGQMSEEGWQPLPMVGELRAAVYGGELDGVNYGDGVFARYSVSAPVNGWYWFFDRHSEATDPHSADGLLGRYSMNYSAAVFDADRNTLYYYELDT